MEKMREKADGVPTRVQQPLQMLEVVVGSAHVDHSLTHVGW